MTDQLKAIPFNTGLNEVVSDLNANAGDVRRSLNYAVQAEGGYEWIGGLMRWSGDDVTINLDSVEVLEIEGTTVVPTLVTIISGTGVRARFIGYIQRGFRTLVVVEKERSTDNYIAGSIYADQGASSVTVLNASPVLTDDEELQVLNLTQSYAPGRANQPSGSGDIVMMAENDGYLYVVRMDGNDALIQRTGGGNAWIPVGTITMPALTPKRWEAYSYTFAGQNPSLFIVNGHTPAYRAESAPAVVDPPISEINDGVAEFPTHVIVHQDHLFLAYPQGRILHSSLGDPTNFAALGGAAELSAGGEITGFQILPGDSLGIFCEDRIRILQGTSVADWTLQEYSDEAGAAVGTIQNMPTTIFSDRRGIGTLSTSDTYGNFRDKTLTQRVDPVYQSIRQNAELYSAVNRSKSQYRLINEDGRGLYLTFAGSALAGAMEIDLGVKITAMGSLRGDEDRVFVAVDGWVYQLDYQTSFYNTDPEAFIELVDHHYGNPRQKKRFSQIDLDVVGDPRVRLEVTNLIDGGKDYYEDNVPVEFDTLSRTSNNYRQDLLSRYRQRFEGTAYLCGSGVSQSIRITHKSNNAHSIKAAIVHYRARGQKR